MNTIITVETQVHSPVDKVWDLWTNPAHIAHWNHASEDWFTPWAENDLQVGGKFRSRMEAKDGSFGFDFEGIYDVVEENQLIEYSIGDGRKVRIEFNEEGSSTHVFESFEAESTNPVELQKNGWQAILDNFRKYAETI